MKKSIILFALVIATFLSHAQDPTDCINYMAVCSNGDISENSNGAGNDDFDNPNNDAGCINYEHQSLWLLIAIESGTTLGFNIDPIGLDDYDFAIYGPNLECDNLGGPIRCSWAAGSSDTGMNGTAGDVSEGAGGDGFVQWLNVQPGEIYYVFIDNFSASNIGFDLEWTGDAVLNCDITLPCPIVELGNDTTLCDGEELTLGGNSLPNESYLWSTGATSSSITVSDAGLYWLSVTKNDCTEADSIMISVADAPTVDLGEDQVLCTGSTVTLDATNAQATSYMWQDGSTDPTFTVTQTGTYSVVVSNRECSASDEVMISIQDLPTPTPRIEGPDFICEGISETLSVTSVVGNTYLWSTGGTGNSISVTEGGTYTVVESNDCESASDTIVIEGVPGPNAEIQGSDEICEGETVQLSVALTDLETVEWSDGSTESDLEVADAGIYWAEVTNDCGTLRDSIVIEMVECECRYFIPNAFSPNADGLNDRFTPNTSSSITDARIRIFSRYGELVFEGDGNSAGWDGKFKDESVPQGVYSYIIELDCSVDGEVIVEKGNITILR